MTDLENRLMSGKTVSYVSDSDDDDDNNEAYNIELEEQAAQGKIDDLSNPYTGPQTGPKGVLEDYKQYKNICRIEQQEAIKEQIAIHKKMAFTADPNKHPDPKNKTNDDSDDEEDFDFEDDEFLKEYHAKRLAQLQKNLEDKITQKLPQFGELFDLKSAEDLLNVIEKENKETIVIVHLYDPNINTCVLMNDCLKCLAQQYRHVKFCKVLASQAGLSLQFKLNALPALQVYKNGSLIGNYIKMQEQLDKIFYTADVENFLIEVDVFTANREGCKTYDDYDIVDDED